MIVPRHLGPFSEQQRIRSEGPPEFRGGWVILIDPVSLNDAGLLADDPPILFGAWPADLVGGVFVLAAEDDES